MTITDTAQLVIEALVSIVDHDTELRTLFGRTTDLIMPFDTLSVLPPLPAIVFQPSSRAPHRVGVDALTVEFSAYATTLSTANKAVTRLEYLFATAGITWTLFIAHGAVGTVPNPTALPFRRWPGTQPDQDDPAPQRADLTLSFLLPA